jgi:hypothetical protein
VPGKLCVVEEEEEEYKEEEEEEEEGTTSWYSRQTGEYASYEVETIAICSTWHSRVKRCAEGEWAVDVKWRPSIEAWHRQMEHDSHCEGQIMEYGL